MVEFTIKMREIISVQMICHSPDNFFNYGLNADKCSNNKALRCANVRMGFFSQIKSAALKQKREFIKIYTDKGLF